MKTVRFEHACRLAALSATVAVHGCTSGAESLGVAEQAASITHCLLDVHTDTGTFHFEGPDWLIGSVEGRGPQSLNLRIGEYVQPAVSTSTTDKPTASEISSAVGYSLTRRYEVLGASTATVDAGRFQRLEAYADYQRTIWEIRDAACATTLGAGASYKPVGIYFKVVDAGDTRLPEVGVYVVDPTGVPDPVPVDVGAGGGGALSLIHI